MPHPQSYAIHSRQDSSSPPAPPDTLVTGLPTGGHGARVFAIDGNSLFVVVGSRTNACQTADRQLESPGIPDCPELQTRAGVWQFDVNRLRQTQADAQRFATGIRNAVAFTRHPTTGALYAVQHGRDNFVQNWPKLYDQKESAEQPSEEFLHVTRGSDYGWPFCYHDRARDKELLAPEYGGDKNAQGRCANVTAPIGSFPGHWGPNDLLFYTGTQFPEKYRGGAFIAFHGSWNRDPEPQAGYNVVLRGWKTANRKRSSRCSRTGSPVRRSSRGAQCTARRGSRRGRTGRSTSRMT